MDSPMFPGNTITIEGLSKCYEMYDKPSDRLKQFAVPTLYRCLGITPRAYFREFWALREVSFTVGKGETVGIIGRNGSGKSTLLQLISGTLNPTSGNIQSQGRIAALLELGTGFNPDFTGRENVYLNAALLGMTTHAIDECYPDIVEFAGIGDFIDQPVKTYSSGMFVRLAFAVQVQVCPDILIVDEALAVGDEAFQRKCYRRIHELKERGVSVLFVSHDAGTVVQLCDRVILLEGGRKIMEGPAKPVVSMYQKLLYAGVAAENNLVNDIQLAETQTVQASSEAQEHSLLDEDWDPNLAAVSTLDYVNHGASISEVRLTNSRGIFVNILTQGQRYRLCYNADFSLHVRNVVFGMMAKTISGLELGGAATDQPGHGYPNIYPGQTYHVQIEFTCLLNPGTYFMNTGIMGIVDENLTYLARKIDVLMFRVRPVEKIKATGWVNFEVMPTAKRIA